jgi:hypothetical protein
VKTGRPRKYASDAERKRAYRKRRKQSAVDLVAKGILHLEWLNDEEVTITMPGKAFIEAFMSVEVQAYISLLRKSVCPFCGGSAWRRLPDGRERCADWESEKETTRCPGTRALYEKASDLAGMHSGAHGEREVAGILE